MVNIEEIVEPLREKMPEQYEAFLSEGEQMETGFRHLEAEFATIYKSVLEFEQKLEAQRPSQSSNTQ